MIARGTLILHAIVLDGLEHLSFRRAYTRRRQVFFCLPEN
jgi:hypothetical protein